LRIHPRNAMKKLLVLITILYLLFSCSGGNKKVEDHILKDYKADFNQYFSDNYDNIVIPKINGIELDSINWVHSFYKKNNYSTTWINDSIQLTEEGIELISQLTESKKYGLANRLYDVNTLTRFKNKLDKAKSKDDSYAVAANLEILLTHYFMQHGKHLNYGILNSVDSLTMIPRKKLSIDLPKYLYNALKTDSIIDKLLGLQPLHPQYLSLQKGLEKFLQNSSLSTKNIQVHNFRIDSLKAIKQAKKALILHKYLTSATNDSKYLEALAKFQLEHGLIPDKLIGNNTAQALSISPYRYYKQIVANLERWRWKDNWTSDYLFVNIPSYTMQLYNKDKLIRDHKIIVGKLENPTPEIIDTLEYIIAYPYWNVPRSISVKEILVKAQEDTTYLKRNNYEILTDNKEELDPNSINWDEVNEDNFNYLIRQKGGSSNALGLVKFIFPNRYAIYLHDTPTKYYFDQELRAYSHGCVRVEKALDLADHILKTDNNTYNIDSVYKYIEMGKEKPMELNTKIPINIFYFTTGVDNAGNIIFYNDVYKKDEKLISELSVIGK